MRKLLMPALLGALVLALAGPAAADKPLIEHIRFDNETERIPAGDLCEFDVLATMSGRLRVATFLNKDGSLRRVMENPSFVTTYTNPLTGNSVTSPDRGLDKITFNEDGMITIHGTGIHFRHEGQFMPSACGCSPSTGRLGSCSRPSTTATSTAVSRTSFPTSAHGSPEQAGRPTTT